MQTCDVSLTERFGDTVDGIRRKDKLSKEILYKRDLHVESLRSVLSSDSTEMAERYNVDLDDVEKLREDFAALLRELGLN